MLVAVVFVITPFTMVDIVVTSDPVISCKVRVASSGDFLLLIDPSVTTTMIVLNNAIARNVSCMKRFTCTVLIFVGRALIAEMLSGVVLITSVALAKLTS